MAVKKIRAIKASAIRFISLTACMACFCAGCAAVSPLKRKNLSDPVMKIRHDEQEKNLNDHIFERREGSPGGSGNSAGGCGC